MTINLEESIDSILKKTRNPSISYMLMTTYTCNNKFFTYRGKQMTTMMIVGHIYFEGTTKTLYDA